MTTRATVKKTNELRRVLGRPTQETKREVSARVSPEVRRAVARSIKRNSDALKRLANY